MKNPRNGGTASYRDVAREHMRCGRQDQAEQWFLRVLGITPDDVEAILFLGERYFARGEHSKAIELLRLAEHSEPENADVLQQLGTAFLAVGDFSGAVIRLQRALTVAPDRFVARLQLGIALEQTGDTHEALIAHAVAVRMAQEKGRWLNDETTAPGMRDVVRYSIRYVNNGRKELLNGVMGPLRKRYGVSELVRVEDSLKIYLGEKPGDTPDARQQPKFLYFPGIPSQPYYPSDRFPWIAELEAATETIREELLLVLSQDKALESFLQTDSQQGAAELLRSSSLQDPAWDAYFFHRHGERYEAHRVACPQTTAVLDSLPLAFVRDHSPETLYSVLRPGTHILPHRGVTNTRLVTHLPLIVPPDCALRVGGETHVWKEGQCVTFDDTFEHEAWNKSDQTRAVLIVDSWNPDLTQVERAAVSDLVAVTGDFNRAVESFSFLSAART